MIHILRNIADWIVENEKKEETQCSIPNEIIDNWLKTIETHRDRMIKYGKTGTEEYDMLQDLDQRVKEIEAIRKQKCTLGAS